MYASLSHISHSLTNLYGARQAIHFHALHSGVGHLVFCIYVYGFGTHFAHTFAILSSRWMTSQILLCEIGSQASLIKNFSICRVVIHRSCLINAQKVFFASSIIALLGLLERSQPSMFVLLLRNICQQHRTICTLIRASPYTSSIFRWIAAPVSPSVTRL